MNRFIKRKNRPIRLAVIGAKGAGKTTLMAGYAAVCPNVGGMDDTSRKFLEDQFKAWDNGQWPDPTKSEQTINFRIGQSGCDDAIVSFAEYMGESFSGGRDARYLDRLVGNPDIALLLVNPRMPDYADPDKRAGFENDARKVIDYLVERSGGRIVLALVWTASDTDSAQSDEFRSFSKRLRDYVGVRLPCEVFPVSLFGRMEDETSPPGRPSDPKTNTSPKPFEWALSIVESRRRTELRKKFARCLVACAAIVSLIAFFAIAIASCCSRTSEERQYEALKTRLTRMGKAPADNADPQSLKNWATDWTAATNKATDRTLPNLLDLRSQYENELPEWQRRQLEERTKDLCHHLASVAFSLGMNRAIVANFQKWYRESVLLEESQRRDYPAVSESDFKTFRNRLADARESCKDRFRSLFSDRKAEALDEPKISGVWKEILSDDEYRDYLESIQNPIQGEMDSSASKIRTSLDSKRAPADVARDCKSWCDKNIGNPHRGEVADYALSLIGGWIEAYEERTREQPSKTKTMLQKQINDLDSDFDKFKDLCAVLNTPFWNDFADRWPVVLARTCAAEPWCSSASKYSTAFPQTFELSKVEVIWKEEGHKWDTKFEGWTISFKIVDRSFEGKEEVRYEGLKDSDDRDKVTLSKKKPDFEKPVVIWPREGHARSEVVCLGHQLELRVRIRELMYTNWAFLVHDGLTNQVVKIQTDRNGRIVADNGKTITTGYLEQTYPIFFDNVKGTKDTKSTLVFRFYVTNDGKALGGLIQNAKNAEGKDK